MLNFVFGRNYCNKTEYLRNLAADKVKSGGEGLIFIVPEQFSYDTEKGMLEKVGAAGMQNIEVLSLTRLAELVLEKTGKKSDKQTVDKGVKMLTMSMALDELSDKLEIFRKYATRPALTESIVSLATELKQCSVSVDELSEYAQKAEQSTLKSKLEELALIINTYNTMLSSSYYDNDDVLSLLGDVLCEYKYFEGKSVYIDGFTRFTKQETGVIEKIIAQSEDVYMAFNTDVHKDDGDCPQFDNVNSQIGKIRALAQECRVNIAKPVIISEPDEGINGELLALEESLFSPTRKPFEERPENVTVYAADNKADECNFVAMSIKKLMRDKGVRCRDIIVYQRDKGVYDSQLVSAFRRYGVPFFEDRRQPVEAQPLMVFVSSLLELVCNGITTESLMRYLKTGLTSLTDDEIAELESYAFYWNIKTSQWKNDFTENPNGLGKEMGDEEKAELAALNELRKKAVGPVLKFKNEFTEAEGEQKAKLLFDYFKNNDIASRLKTLSASLIDSDNRELFLQQDAVWSVLMGMLDRLYLACRSSKITNKRFYDLFNIILAVSDLGTLPQGLDGVTLALADRTRTGIKKYAFVVGANDGAFPKTPSTEGLLNDADRLMLKSAGIELAETAQYKGSEEQYIAYCALCSASDGLFVSYSLSDYSGTSLAESEIVSEIRATFPEAKVLLSTDFSAVERIESKSSAFEELASNYNGETDLAVSLEDYFKDDSLFSGRVTTLRNAAEKRERRIEDREIATKLFGKNMLLSYSKVESYQNCPFKFFCSYGLKAEPKKAAVIDYSLGGTIVHSVFESILKKFSKNDLENMDDALLKAEIEAALEDYLNEYMGGAESKSERFLKSYRSRADDLFVVFKRMCEEFRNCEFEPREFELGIGFEGGIPAYEVKLDDGGSLRINGSIDRVDTYETGDKTYLRIIDYKSSGKNFYLKEAINGFNLQMLIYMFSLYDNGKKRFGDFTPCGILYMPANTAKADLGRDADEEAVKKKQLYDKKMTGLLTDDRTALEGMEKGLNGYFIPVELKDGKLTGSFVSLGAFMKLKDEVDKALKSVAESLHEGVIRALPMKDACGHCDYKSVCGFEDGDPVLEVVTLSEDEAKSILEGEADENGEV